MTIEENCADVEIRRQLREPPGDQLMTSEQWKEVGIVLNLSRREMQVIRCLFAGITRDAIAVQLGIKSRTVRQYMERLHRKLHVSDRVSLVLRVIQVRDFLARSPSGEREEEKEC